jgi:hypothetical protein
MRKSTNRSKNPNGKQQRRLRENGQSNENETCVAVLLLRRQYESDVDEADFANDIVGRIVVRGNGQRILHLNRGAMLHWRDFAEGAWELQMVEAWTSGRRLATPEFFGAEKVTPIGRASEKRSIPAIEAMAGRAKGGYAIRQP